MLNVFDEKYKGEIKFLWINNVFMPDSWKQPIPDYETFIGNGIGKLGIDGAVIKNGATGYDEVMSPIIAKYNDVKRNGKEGRRWNGFMLLPIITGLITFASTKLMKQNQPPVPASANGQNGQNVVEYHLWTPKWTEMLQASKFKKGGDFPYAFDLLNNMGGEKHEGYIGLQDHGDNVQYRNIRIKVMD